MSTLRRCALFLLPVLLLLVTGCGEEISHEQPLADANVRAAETVFGLDLTASERTMT